MDQATEGTLTPAGYAPRMDHWLRLMKWTRLNKYLDLSGDTRDAVYQRRRCGKWLDGIHWRRDPDGNLWINIEAVTAWVNGQKPYLAA